MHASTVAAWGCRWVARGWQNPCDVSASPGVAGSLASKAVGLAGGRGDMVLFGASGPTDGASVLAVGTYLLVVGGQCTDMGSPLG